VIPKNTPQQKRAKTQAILSRAAVVDLVCLVGIRGYFLDTMGVRGKNDVGIYDDAILLISPNVHAAFNANVDPGRLGWNDKVRKPMAQLKPGLWKYKLGMHGISRGNPYKALVQAAPVTVFRGQSEETGWFGINIHRGSRTNTSSEGCQTLPEPCWTGFINLVEAEMKRNNAKTIPYLLVENR